MTNQDHDLSTHPGKTTTFLTILASDQIPRDRSVGPTKLGTKSPQAGWPSGILRRGGSLTGSCLSTPKAGFPPGLNFFYAGLCLMHHLVNNLPDRSTLMSLVVQRVSSPGPRFFFLLLTDASGEEPPDHDNADRTSCGSRVLTVISVDSRDASTAQQLRTR